MAECTNDCSNCSENCDSRDPKSFLEKENQYSHIGKVIAVVSGKGGVGKSMVTSLLANTMRKKGYRTAIMDADITGPSIPRSFGISEKAAADEKGLYPVRTRGGIEIMSINLILPNETDPVVWRGPIIAGSVKQFWTDVIWGDIDYMFVDMPPGTGDVPLTVFQSLPVDGIVIVTSPQELVSMIVAKAVNMAKLMNIPILGLVENMSYFQCPNCGEKHRIFGNTDIRRTAQEFGIETAAEMPIDPALTAACDEGRIEDFDGQWLSGVWNAIAE